MWTNARRYGTVTQTVFLSVVLHLQTSVEPKGPATSVPQVALVATWPFTIRSLFVTVQVNGDAVAPVTQPSDDSVQFIVQPPTVLVMVSG